MTVTPRSILTLNVRILTVHQIEQLKNYLMGRVEGI